MCQWDQFPGLVWPASSDQSNALGVTCRRVDGPLPGLSSSSSARLFNILRHITSFPF